jgi:hypothetical protein
MLYHKNDVAVPSLGKVIFYCLHSFLIPDFLMFISSYKLLGAYEKLSLMTTFKKQKRKNGKYDGCNH